MFIETIAEKIKESYERDIKAKTEMFRATLNDLLEVEDEYTVIKVFRQEVRNNFIKQNRKKVF